ncbi:MAG: hypothetical protein ACJATQ_000176 [Cellvibrionaceae bacterium]|jgi:hypothetical protein
MFLRAVDICKIKIDKLALIFIDTELEIDLRKKLSVENLLRIQLFWRYLN